MVVNYGKKKLELLKRKNIILAMKGFSIIDEVNDAKSFSLLRENEKKNGLLRKATILHNETY